jgi:hypothetical protein
MDIFEKLDYVDEDQQEQSSSREASQAFQLLDQQLKRQKYRNVLEGYMTFDDMRKWEEVHGYAPVNLLPEAMSATVALATQVDERLGQLAGALGPKELRDLWESLTTPQSRQVQPMSMRMGKYQRALWAGYQKVVSCGKPIQWIGTRHLRKHCFRKMGPTHLDEVSSGPNDWARTVIETVRDRTPLYAEEWEESLFSIQYGWGPDSFRVYPEPHDEWVMRTIAYLEGDNHLLPINHGKKSIHRDNGDWMVRWHNTLTVWVSARALSGHRLNDADNLVGDEEWDHIHLKRGRNPLKEGEKAPVLYWASPSGELLPLGQVSYKRERRRLDEIQWKKRVLNLWEPVEDVPEEEDDTVVVVSHYNDDDHHIFEEDGE